LFTRPEKNDPTRDYCVVRRNKKKKWGMNANRFKFCFSYYYPYKVSRKTDI